MTLNCHAVWLLPLKIDLPKGDVMKTGAFKVAEDRCAGLNLSTVTRSTAAEGRVATKEVLRSYARMDSTVGLWFRLHRCWLMLLHGASTQPM